jgi:hypothetical protein
MWYVPRGFIHQGEANVYTFCTAIILLLFLFSQFSSNDVVGHVEVDIPDLILQDGGCKALTFDMVGTCETRMVLPDAQKRIYNDIWGRPPYPVSYRDIGGGKSECKIKFTGVIAFLGYN